MNPEELRRLRNTAWTEPVTIGNATLYCGDALAVLQSLESESVAGALLDKIYGKTRT